MEAKTGSRMVVSSNFSKPSGGSSGPVPMDVDSLVKVVSGNLASLVKKVGKGDVKGTNANKIKFDGNCDNCGKYGQEESQGRWQRKGQQQELRQCPRPSRARAATW